MSNAIAIKECTLCQAELQLVLALAPTPLANEFLPLEADKELFPLNLMQCKKCHHLQLDTEVNMFRLFKHYTYTSNTSSSNYNYLHAYATQMYHQFMPNFVVDIGGNDGTFLHFFQQLGSKVLNVDPAENIVEIAKNNNIDSECVFFNELNAVDIKVKHGQADLITCNNMFAHNRDLTEVLKGVKWLLAEKGTFVIEVSYAAKMLQHNLFDLIYHEHLHHWHLRPLYTFLLKYDLWMYDAEVIEQTHGGSLRVYVKHAGKQMVQSERLIKLLDNERLNFAELVDNFKNNVQLIKENLTNMLTGIKGLGKQIGILGYPAKMCTVSYYLGLDQFICNIYDNNPLKIGKYSHQGMLIEDAANIYKNKPDYLLIGSWNYQNELMQRYSLFAKTGGHFITTFPELKVV